MDDVQYPTNIHPALVADMQQEKKEKESKQAQEAVTVIERLDDDFTLSSWGYSEPLKVTRGKEVKYITLPIKSVGVQDLIDQTERNQPRPPSTMKNYKKGTAEARAYGGDIHNVLVREVDYSDPAYMQAMEEHNRRSGQMLVLQGIGADMTDPKDNGRIVLKGSDKNEPNQIIDADAAIARLRKMGVTGAHYATLLRNIRALTEDVEKQEDRE